TDSYKALSIYIFKKQKGKKKSLQTARVSPARRNGINGLCIRRWVYAVVPCRAFGVAGVSRITLMDFSFLLGKQKIKRAGKIGSLSSLHGIFSYFFTNCKLKLAKDITDQCRQRAENGWFPL